VNGRVVLLERVSRPERERRPHILARMVALVRQAVGHLPRDQHQVVRMRYWQEYTVADVARCTVWTRAEVSEIEAAALARLRAELEEPFEELAGRAA